MRKFIVFILALLVIFFTFNSPVFAKNSNMSENAVLEKDTVINEDYFNAGEGVIISGTINGDAYVAGGDVIIDGKINGDLLVAGGNVKIPGEISGDVRVAGGNLDISGTIGGNLTALGGAVTIDKDAILMGSLVSAAGNIDINSPIGKGATLAAGNVNLGSKVGGNVNAFTGELSLNSGAEIAGDLTYFSDKELLKTQESTVSGRITHNLPPKQDIEKAKSTAAAFSFGWNVFGFLSSLLVGVLLIYLFPNFMQKSSDQIIKKPGPSFLVGLVSLVVIPFIVLLLMITIIGIPLGILLLVVYIFLMWFSHLFAALTLGKIILKRLNSSANLFISMGVGILALSILGVIPILGGLISLLALTFGLGSYLITKKVTISHLRSQKVI